MGRNLHFATFLGYSLYPTPDGSGVYVLDPDGNEVKTEGGTTPTTETEARLLVKADLAKRVAAAKVG